MGKKEKLAEIVASCERRFNRGAAEYWKHGDFGDLSTEIRRDTGVVISAHTLKRIFGKISVEDDYQPQQATLNAMMQYCGYTEADHKQETQVAIETDPVERSFSTATTKEDKKKSINIIAIVAIIVAVLASFIVIKSVFKGTSSGSIRQIETEGILPATVFFEVKSPNISDSLFVDFGDKSALLFIKKEQIKIAHNYLLPGVFKVKLLTKKELIATTNVGVQSQGWIGLGFHRQRDLPEHYYAFPAVKSGPDSLFHINNGQLYKVGLDTLGSIFTRLCNFAPVHYDKDDFIFETIFKNDLLQEGLYCSATQFEIAGINGIIRFKFVNPGCSSWVMNVVSEQTFEGSKVNLSHFTINLGQWNTVRLINKNKHIILSVNDKPVYEGDYKNSLGDIKGLHLQFTGNGYVKKCDLKDADGNLLYHF